jgi:hypothetical protein
MASDMHRQPPGAGADEHGPIEMPKPTGWPMVAALGVAFMLFGVATNVGIIFVGALILIIGLGGWVAQLSPGRGHGHEERVEPDKRPQPVAARPGTVERLAAGRPGYRLRLPVEVHPTTAGVWGGVVGGLVMPIPAILWSLISGHGLWYPVNLLAGMVLPGLENMSVEQLEQFSLGLFLAGVAIHVVFCVVIGLCYGVLLPTLPDVPMAVAWGGLLMPVLWTAVSYTTMHIVNPVMEARVSWPWFIVSQFVYGIVSANVFLWLRQRWPGLASGILGGLAGGLVMPLPAVLWGLHSGHGAWYPVNLLAGMAVSGMDQLPTSELETFHLGWFAIALGIHLTLSILFGIAYHLVLPRLRPIPGPMAWGALIMPALWTGTSYGLIGVVNLALQQHINWPWYVFSQFLFGLAASIVVLRSEVIPVLPAGSGPSEETRRSNP